MEDFRFGVYRTRDNIDNFRLRVRVRKVTPSIAAVAAGSSAASLAVAQLSSSASSSVAGSCESVRSAEKDEAGQQQQQQQHKHQQDNDEVIVVSWQQKVFNKSEEDYYAGKKEEEFEEGDALGRKFYHDVKLQQRQRQQGRAGRVYTVIDGELIRPSDSEELDDEQTMPYVPMTTNLREEPNHLAQLMSDGLRRRRHLEATTAATGSSSSYSSVADKSTIPTTNLVIEDPGREMQMRLHTPSGHWQLMSVRFDLSSDDDGGGGELQQPPTTATGGPREGPFLELCFVRFGTNGLMELSPDFTHNKKPYRVENNGNAYEYWIENISPTMQYETQLKETLMLNEVYSKVAQQRLATIGEDFEIPPDRAFRLLLNAELVSAQGFEYDGLFVHYFIELPLGWTATANDSQQQQLYGMTQTSRCSSSDVAHFSHAFQVDLLFDLNRFDLDRESLPKWPQIFFEVVSVDDWTRCRTEGYGFSSVPYAAGCYDVCIDTWRPIVPRSEMKRYFVGGSPELDDLSYAGTPGDVSDGKVLSRFGLRTVSSGSVRLRMNVVHQSKAFLGGDHRRAQRVRTLMDRLGSATLFSSVSAVLEAFEKARQRMARATRKYDVNMDRNLTSADA